MDEIELILVVVVAQLDRLIDQGIDSWHYMNRFGHLLYMSMSYLFVVEQRRRGMVLVSFLVGFVVNPIHILER